MRKELMFLNISPQMNGRGSELEFIFKEKKLRRGKTLVKILAH